MYVYVCVLCVLCVCVNLYIVSILSFRIGDLVLLFLLFHGRFRSSVAERPGEATRKARRRMRAWIFIYLNTYIAKSIKLQIGTNSRILDNIAKKKKRQIWKLWLFLFVLLTTTRMLKLNYHAVLIVPIYVP